MARQNIDIGIQGNDGTGDSIRESFRKVNENFVQLFAVFGSGDRIAFTDLDDTPNSYGADQVIVSNPDADALVAKSLVGGEGVAIDHSDENEIRIIATGGKLGNDVRPNLGGHLNAQGFSIGNLADPTDETAASYNDLHDASITSDDLVITKGWADQRYLQASGGPGAGSQVRVRDEPTSTEEYTLLISDWIDGYAFIPDHGFNTGQNGISYVYNQTGSVPASGLIEGNTYFIGYESKDLLSIHTTRSDAVEGIYRIFVNDPEISAENRGTETLVDAYFDSDLEGNWASNEALPRKSVVRRQGDTMEGTLYLADHPGSLAGSGSPNGSDDLQAATKFYVDNSSFASDVNIFVRVTGDDEQTNTPPGKEGRAYAYAYSTVSAACQQAIEIINESLIEPGPYRQQITYGDYVNPGYLYDNVSGSGATRNIKIFTDGNGVDQSKDLNNRDLREGSIIKGLHSGATARVVFYNGTSGSNDDYEVEMLQTTTDVTYYTTNFFNAARNLNVNKEFIKEEVIQYVSTKYPSLSYNEDTCARDTGLIVDALVFDLTYGGNTKSIRAGRAYWSGVTSVLPAAQKIPTLDAIDYILQLASDIIDNTTIPAAVGVGYGKRSLLTQDTSGQDPEAKAGTILTRLVTSISTILNYGPSGTGEYREFIAGETLEFGQPVPQTQVTIHVESGVYYEQLPIRVPANVSIKGDEFRRSIIRPAPGQSRSPWAGLYFYRDSEFDGLSRTYYYTDSGASSTGRIINLSSGTIDGLESGMYLYVTSGTGVFAPGTYVTRTLTSTSFEISKDPTVPLVGANFRGLNNLNLAPDGQNFGYHYLSDPSGLSGIFESIPSGGATTAAGLLTSNRTLIQDEVIKYIDDRYTAFVYDADKCSRDVGYIIDAVRYDLMFGSNFRSIKAGMAYYRANSAYVLSDQIAQTVGALQKLKELIVDTIISVPGAVVSASANMDVIINIITSGLGAVPAVSLTDPSGYDSNLSNARRLIVSNKNFIIAEITAWIDQQKATSTSPFTPSFTYDVAKCEQDVGYLMDALRYDLTYGGNLETIVAARAYFEGTSSLLGAGEKAPTLATYTYLKSLVAQIVTGTAVTPSPGNSLTQDNTGSPANISTSLFAQARIQDVYDTINTDGTLPPEITPDLTWVSSDLVNANNTLLSSKTTLQTDVINYINSTYAVSFEYNKALCYRDVGYIVDALVYDLENGGVDRSIAAAASYSANASALVAITDQLEQTLAAIQYINDLAQYIIDSTTLPAATTSTSVGRRGTETQTTGGAPELNSDSWVASLVGGIVNSIAGINNPPKENKYMDVFLLNDACILRNITCQGHGGFMCVLDPEGQIQTKSPYFQTCTSLSGSTNQHRFAGGMFVDGFCGNLPMVVEDVVDSSTIEVSGLTFRKPGVPNSFYLSGVRYQLNAVRNYNRSEGTAIFSLDQSTPFEDEYGNPINPIATGLTSSVDIVSGEKRIYMTSTAGLTSGMRIVQTGGAGAIGLDSVIEYVDPAYIRVSNNHTISGAVTFRIDGITSTVETPGNRSMLSNDFTQINDLGYGLVATNNAISECVSVFTYYNWTSYYANNGGQIRSVTGSTCNGVYGLKAEGRDPNEVPDPVLLSYNTVQSAQISKTGATATKNLEGDRVVYIDFYQYIPFNISELEIDHSPTFSELQDGFTISNGGSGYSVGDILQAVGGTVKTGKQPSSFIVTETDGGGAGPGVITGLEVIDAGQYVPASAGAFVNTPVGVYPTSTGSFSLSGGGGSSALLSGTFLGVISRYEITNVELTTYLGNGVDVGGTPTTPFVLKLNLNTDAGDDSASTLISDLMDNQIVTIRGRQNFEFEGVEEVKPTRPSTALEFTDEYELGTVYRTLAYNTTANVGGLLPAEHAVLTFDNGYEYVLLLTDETALSTADPSNPGQTLGASAGDTKLAVKVIGSTKTIGRLNSGKLAFAWQGRLHTITSYTPGAGAMPTYIEFDTAAYGSGSIVPTATVGLESPFTSVRQTTVRAGILAGNEAEITVNISTCRATGHDFLDVGTGSFNDTNYPTNLLGSPANDPAQANEAIEATQGRVFYVSTDQNGIFRVGKFFTVDQGTGTVTFSASIALSNLDGLGFKTGSVVREFSNDPTMVDNSETAVPTEYAVRTYIDKRLGYDYFGNSVTLSERIPANSGGFLPVSGSPTLAADLDMGGGVPPVRHRIKNVTYDPSQIYDAATIGYVNDQVELRDSLFKLKDVNLMVPVNGDLAGFAGATDDGGAVQISLGIKGDIGSTFTSDASSPLVGSVPTTSVVPGIPDILQTQVNNGIVVNDISGFPNPTSPAIAYILINDEIFSYTGITAASNRFDGVVRARFTTTPTIHAVDDMVYSLDLAKLDLQIQPEVIVNADVSTTAAIVQSKLAMNAATTRANATSITQADRGLASFDSSQFDATDGWISVKDSGIGYAKLANIADGSILGNFTGSATYPQEVSSSSIAENGINSLFVNSTGGANVLTRRVNPLKQVTLTGIRSGTPFNTTSGSFTNIPLTSITGTGYGAIATIAYSGGAYTGITVTFGGHGYVAGDQLKADGALLGGASGTNDFSITIVGADVDSVTKLELQKVTTNVDATSIIRTDASKNLGNAASKFNNVYLTTMYGNVVGAVKAANGTTILNNGLDGTDATFTGVASSASKSTNLAGGNNTTLLGSIPYQSNADTTTLLSPNTTTTKKYLSMTGDGTNGATPSWESVPDGDANNLTGTTLASTVVNSSLTSVGTLSGLTVNGNVTVQGATNRVYVQGFIRQSVSSNVAAAGSDIGTATSLTSTINIVTTSTPSDNAVKLPANGTGTEIAGLRIIIRNSSLNNISVFPGDASSRIGDNAAGDPVTLEVGAALEYFASSSTQWYNLNSVFA